MKSNGEKTQIILVDDDLETQENIIAFFKPKGYSVTCFGNSKSALMESMITGHNWDVLLAKFHFANMPGTEFALQIRNNLPNLPVIFVAPPEATETIVKEMQEVAYDFILKPINFYQLKISIERAMHLGTSPTREVESDFVRRLNAKSISTSKTKIIGQSPNFIKALDLAKRAAKSSANILIIGESGSGKEVFAKHIHEESKHKKGAFIAINCSAIPENLLESELFGHAKGSFTGAQFNKIGLFEEAQDGTLFLDEIGDLSLTLQAKLLRVLQEKVIRRIGENQIRPINCRIISATHKDLLSEVNAHHFREDLFFRLDVIPILIPPLRDRKEDLLPLAEAFLSKYASENSSQTKCLSKEAIKFILENPWRGNVRELENMIERGVALCQGSTIFLDDFFPMSTNMISKHTEFVLRNNTFTLPHNDDLPTLDEVIIRYIEYAVEKRNGAKDMTAREIGIDRKTLYKRLNSQAVFVQR